MLNPIDELFAATYAPIFPIAVWVMLLLYCVAVGRKSTKETGGNWLRLLFTSVGLATMGTLPALVVAGFDLCDASKWEQYIVAIGSIFVSLLLFCRCLTAPFLFPGADKSYSQVNDPSLIERIAELSREMVISVPTVRIWKTAGDEQRALGFIGCLQAPQIILTDGILQRLTNDERDSIIAHELAHLANWSLGFFVAVFPVTAALTTLCAHWMSLEAAIPFGLLVFSGLYRIISRFFEIDCDLRAARTTGFRSTVSALRKIHMLLPIPNKGLFARLFYAIVTHPPCDVRLAALCQMAPADDRPEVSPVATDVRMHIRSAQAAFVLWILILACTLLWSYFDQPFEWFPILPFTAALLPCLIIPIAMRKQRRLASRRLGKGSLGLGNKTVPILFAIFAVISSWIAMVLTEVLETDLDWPLGIIGVSMTVILISLLVVVWRSLGSNVRRKSSKLNSDVVIALQQYDFERALSLCEENLAIVNKRSELRYHRALSRFLCGHEQEAIEELRQWWTEKQDFPLAGILLASLLVNSGDFQEAIDVARAVGNRLPGDPAPPLIEARAQRLLGQLDAASAACQRAESSKPGDANILAMKAAIELDLGHLDQAQSLIVMAQELGPGAPLVMSVNAEIVLEEGSEKSARIAVSEAVKSIRSNPFNTLDNEARFLESELARRFPNDTTVPVSSEDSSLSQN